MNSRVGERFEKLVDIMRALRAPDGCPWDREQTHASLRPFLLEETYEVLEAIESGTPHELCEELGDVLFEVVFMSHISEDAGDFTLADAIDAICDKLVRRHPHVFGDVVANDADQVLVNWEKLKQDERKAENKSVLSGVPRSLPALLKAGRLTEKAARVGFDWRRTEDVFEKLDEETAELREAVASGDTAKMHDEIGDLLFTIANIARKVNVNPEEALQSTNRKFMRRFESMESRVRERDQNLDQLELEEMDRLWDEAKAAERT
jgi:MazG family protein